MNQIRISLFTALLLLTTILSAQDSLPKIKNSISAELLGNSFYDRNFSGGGAGWISVSYNRVVVCEHSSWQLSIGIGPMRSVGRDLISRSLKKPVSVENTGKTLLLQVKKSASNRRILSKTLQNVRQKPDTTA